MNNDADTKEPESAGREPESAGREPESAGREPESAVKIGKAAFLLSAGIILGLMVFSGTLTKALPAGAYERLTENGRTLVVNGSYREIERPEYPAWRWLTAPTEILFSPGNVSLITIILFILCVGGSITILERAGVMEELIRVLVARFAKRKYLLIALVVFFFMAVSSFIGVYEGLIPMIIFFFLVYAIVALFVIRHAKKVEADPRSSPTFGTDETIRAGLRLRGTPAIASAATADLASTGTPSPDPAGTAPGAREAPGAPATDTVETASGAPSAASSSAARKHKALVWFAACIGTAMAVVFATARLPELSDLAFPVMGILFLVGGIGGGKIAGLGRKNTLAALGRGSLNLMPGSSLSFWPSASSTSSYPA